MFHYEIVYKEEGFVMCVQEGIVGFVEDCEHVFWGVTLQER